MLGISNSKMFYIRTKKIDEVQEFIKEMNTGYTIVKADGAYSKKKYDMIIKKNRRKQIWQKIIKQIWEKQSVQQTI